MSIALGIPAFLALVVGFYLMVANPMQAVTLCCTRRRRCGR